MSSAARSSIDPALLLGCSAPLVYNPWLGGRDCGSVQACQQTWAGEKANGVKGCNGWSVQHQDDTGAAAHFDGWNFGGGRYTSVSSRSAGGGGGGGWCEAHVLAAPSGGWSGGEQALSSALWQRSHDQAHAPAPARDDALGHALAPAPARHGQADATARDDGSWRDSDGLCPPPTLRPAPPSLLPRPAVIIKDQPATCLDAHYEQRLAKQRQRVSKSCNAKSCSFAAWLLTPHGSQAYEKGLLLPEIVAAGHALHKMAHQSTHAYASARVS